MLICLSKFKPKFHKNGAVFSVLAHAAMTISGFFHIVLSFRLFSISISTVDVMNQNFVVQ